MVSPTRPMYADLAYFNGQVDISAVNTQLSNHGGVAWWQLCCVCVCQLWLITNLPVICCLDKVIQVIVLSVESVEEAPSIWWILKKEKLTMRNVRFPGVGVTKALFVGNLNPQKYLLSFQLFKIIYFLMGPWDQRFCCLRLRHWPMAY